MSYETALLKVESEEKRRQREEENERVWQIILDRYDQTPGFAFFKKVVEWCNGKLSLDAYDMLCTCPFDEFLDKRWHAGTADFYLQKIVDKLRDRRWSAESIRDKVASLRYKSKPEIRAELQRLGFLETVATLDDAKMFLARHRLLKQQQSYFAPDGSGPFPRLPLHTVPPGFVQAVKVDAKYLNELASQDMAAFQRMVRRYHISQINERLQSTNESLRS